MGSQSSRQKSATNERLSALRRLLCDGASIPSPSREIVDAAELLVRAGIIRYERSEYVLCANAKDQDFPPRSRGCRGQIVLEEGLDENGHEYCCPNCDRPVFPDRLRKQRFQRGRAIVLPDGVDNYLAGLIARFGFAHRRRALGFHQIDIGTDRVFVCVVDYCEDQECATTQWARVQPTCYLYLDVDAAEERLLGDGALCRLSLAGAICDSELLNGSLRDLAAKKLRPTFADPSASVYPSAPAIVQRDDGRTRPSVLVIEVGEDTVRVGGREVVSSRAGERYKAFQMLVKQFLADMTAGRPPEDFRAVSLDALAPSVDDIETTRKTLNRMQTDIAEILQREIGIPVDREDVIATVHSQSPHEGKGGFRLNPRRVAIRPFQQASASSNV